MSRLVKVLAALALAVPVSAYAVGSLVASSADAPADRGPVIIQDDPDSPAVEPSTRPVRPARPTPPARPGGADDEGRDDQPEVVVPKPTFVDDDDDDENDDDDDERDDDDDERDDGDDD